MGDTASGTELIAQERERQVSEEGWEPEHDDHHDQGELVNAALCYARETLRPGPDHPAPGVFARQHGFGSRPSYWPWDVSWWKPSDDPVRNLVKAGALIAAEIDRLQRASTG